MKIVFNEYIEPSEGEIAERGQEAGLTEQEIENMWTTIREVPMILTYDTINESYTIKKE